MPESPFYISQIKDKKKQAQILSGSHYYLHAFRNKIKHGKYVKHFPIDKIRSWHQGYAKLLAKKFYEKYPYSKFKKIYIHKSPIR